MKKSIGARPIVYPTPVFIVGSYDAQGKPNAMAASWGGICCSNPPCLTISLRKATHTYSSLMKRRAYTVNIPSEKYIREADYFGNSTGRTRDKFADTGLTPVKSDLVDAPYIGEFPFIVECRVIHIHEIGLHTQFIGEILDIKVDEAALKSDGFPDIEKVQPFLYAPNKGGYYAIGKRLGSAYSIGDVFKK